MSRPVRSKQAEIAYQVIKRGIFAGRFRPGERLKEERIAEESGVSRTPVREALNWLEHEGVVTSEANRGSRVAPVTNERISDLYQLRARVEGLACSLAAERISEDGLTALRGAILEFSSVVNAHSGKDASIEQLRISNEEVHRLIANAANNPYLTASLNAVRNNPLVGLAYQSFTREELLRSVLFLELVVEAICEGAGERAERLMMEHILQERDVILRAGRFVDKDA